MTACGLRTASRRLCTQELSPSEPPTQNVTHSSEARKWGYCRGLW